MASVIFLITSLSRPSLKLGTHSMIGSMSVVVDVCWFSATAKVAADPD